MYSLHTFKRGIGALILCPNVQYQREDILGHSATGPTETLEFQMTLKKFQYIEKLMSDA